MRSVLCRRLLAYRFVGALSRSAVALEGAGHAVVSWRQESISMSSTRYAESFIACKCTATRHEVNQEGSGQFSPSQNCDQNQRSNYSPHKSGDKEEACTTTSSSSATKPLCPSPWPKTSFSVRVKLLSLPISMTQSTCTFNI